MLKLSIHLNIHIDETDLLYHTQMQKRKAWRPSEMTEEKINKLEYVFALDWTVKEACFYAGISHETYYNWLEKTPWLVERFEALREKPVLLARESVIKHFTKNPEIALKYLERKKKTEFSTRQEIDQNLSGWLTISREWQK